MEETKTNHAMLYGVLLSPFVTASKLLVLVLQSR